MSEEPEQDDWNDWKNALVGVRIVVLPLTLFWFVVFWILSEFV